MTEGCRIWKPLPHCQSLEVAVLPTKRPGLTKPWQAHQDSPPLTVPTPRGADAREEADGFHRYMTRRWYPLKGLQLLLTSLLCDAGLCATNCGAVFIGISLIRLVFFSASPSVAIQGSNASPLLKILYVRWPGRHKPFVLYVCLDDELYLKTSSHYPWPPVMWL